MTRVHVIRYATRAGRRGDHFLGEAERAAEPHPTAYYVWLVEAPDGPVLIDTGMRPGARNRVAGLCHGPSVVDSLRNCGVPADSVWTVVLTHLHYDHAGGVRQFPNARFVVQRSELDAVPERWLVDEDDIDYLHGSGRLDVVDGDADVAAGVSVHHVGGHTAGMQVVRVRTVRADVVVASDASHFYENIDRDRPSPITHDLPAAHRAFARIRELGDVILPGHDPSVPTAVVE